MQFLLRKRERKKETNHEKLTRRRGEIALVRNGCYLALRCSRTIGWWNGNDAFVRRQAVQYGWIIKDGSLARSKEEVVWNSGIGRSRRLSVVELLPSREPGKSVAPRRIISFLIGGTERGGGSWHDLSCNLRRLELFYRLGVSLFVQVSCRQEIQVDTNRKVSLDWTRLLFTPCFHTFLRNWYNIIGLYIYIYMYTFSRRDVNWNCYPSSLIVS